MDKKSGLGASGVLVIIFIVLKMTGLISWGWQWVLSPIWIGWIILLLLWGLIKILEVTSHS